MTKLHLRSRVSTAAAVLLTMLGCGNEPLAGAGRVHQRWVQPQAGYSTAKPAVHGNLVYFGTGDGRVIARERRDGVAKWSTQVAPEALRGGNFVARSGVVVATVRHSAVGLDGGTGRQLWQYETPLDTVDTSAPRAGSLILAKIDADDSTVYIPSWGAAVSAISLTTGAVLWQWRPGRAETDTSVSSVFRSGAEGTRVSGDTVFVSVWHYLVRNGARSEVWLVALDKHTGREHWRVTLPRVESAVGTQAQPALWGNLVLINTLSGDQFAIDRATRRVAWHAPPDSSDPSTVLSANIISPTVAGDVVYHDGTNRYLYARRASDGAVLWRGRYDGQFDGDLAVSSRYVYGAAAATLTVFDRRTGRRVAALEAPTNSAGLFPASVAVEDGQVFAPVDGAAWSFDEP